MKKSIFVWAQKVEENPDKFLLLERTSGESILFNSNEYEYWEEGKIELLDKDTIDFLIENSFLIEDDVDQLAEEAEIRLLARNKDLRKDQLSFIIAPTLYCNARCSYCFENGCEKSRMTSEVEEKTVEFITSLVKKSQSQHLDIAWFGGEPLLEKEVIKRMSKSFIDYVGEENYSASIITNGSLIDDNAIELFHSCNISSVQITFDGDEKASDDVKHYLNPSVHNFSKVMEHIELCCSNDIFVYIYFNLTKSNVSDVRRTIKEIYRRLQRFGELFTITVRPVTGEENSKDLLAKEDLENVFLKIYSEMLDLGILPKDFFFDSIDNLFCKGCYSFCIRKSSMGFSIDPLGYIYKCEHFLGKKNYAVGNVYTGLDEEKEEKFYEFSTRLTEECYSCPLLPNCQGGCLAARKTNVPSCLTNKVFMKFIVQKLYESLYSFLKEGSSS